MDVTTKIGSKVRPKPYRVEAGNSPRMEDLDNATNNQSTHFLKGKRNSDYIPENDSGDGSDNEHADEMTKLGSVASGGIGSMRRITSVNDHIQYDDIRQTSGAHMKGSQMPITINNSCLSHQNKHDTELSMKLFKLACLAYKPAPINYRGSVVERTNMIEMRRNLIDRVSNILAECDLFKNSAFYPKRYYDDLMVDEKGYIDHFVGQ